MVIAVLGSVSTIHGRNPNAIHAWIGQDIVAWEGAAKHVLQRGHGSFAPDITTSGIPG